MEEFYKIGAEYEFMDSLCNTIFDVKLRYYELLRAKALLKVAQENVNLNEKFLTLAKNKEKSLHSFLHTAPTPTATVSPRKIK